MAQVLRDLVYGARIFGRNPLFALTAILTIALGVGASTAIFSVVNAVLLQPLPYSDADRLVLVWGDLRARNVTDFPFPPADFHDLRTRATLFESLAAVQTGRQAVWGDNRAPEQIRFGGVTPNFFRVLGGRIRLGRDFLDEDGTPQPPPPPGLNQAGGQQLIPPRLPTNVILSHGFWQRRYGGDENLVGRSINLGNITAHVIGILEPGFELLFPPGKGIERVPDLWTAMRVDYEHGSRINVFLRVIGKLKADATIAQAQSQADGIAAELRKQFPIKETSGLHFRLEPMHDNLVARVRPSLLALMGAVVFVLLIACANVANLLLVRTALRERELAVRASLGATPWTLVRQMIAESLLLAGMGAVAGLFLADLGISLLTALRPADLPRADRVAIDPYVLGFAAVAALVAAVLFGLAPAIRASRTEVIEVLRTSGRTAGLGGGRLLRNAVVVAEVALSFVLLVGCGLMVRSFIALQKTNPGFDPHGVLTFSVTNSRAQGAQQRAGVVQRVRERLQAIPGVRSVSAVNPLPLDGVFTSARWGTAEALADPSKFQQATVHTVLPGYFETMKTRLLQGRTFTEADSASAARVMIIDHVLAAKAFPDGSAAGKRLLARVITNEAEWYEVIGVVAHQRHASLAADGREAMFFTDGFMGNGAVQKWVVRTEGDPFQLGSQVRTAIEEVDPLLCVAELQPMDALVYQARSPTRFALVLITVFAGIASLLAGVGLYGVLSTVVSQRTAEIGIRMAMGASPTGIFRLMITQGMWISAAGIVLGLAGAYGLTRWMSSMLVEIRPTDPATFAGIIVLFAVIAFLAVWFPSRRAARLEPNSALREE